MTFDVLIHPEIVRGKNHRPTQTINVNDLRIRVSGKIWRDSILVQDMESEIELLLLALVEAGGWIEVEFQQPTTAVGVQFWGDGNDGWARILVDDKEVWTGNTVGSSTTYEDYVEIRGLLNSQHTLRIEATGKPGRDGGNNHVTIAAIGWGQLPVPSTDGSLSILRSIPNAVTALTHLEIIRGQNPMPQHALQTNDPQVRTDGPIWRDSFQLTKNDPSSKVLLLALLGKDSSVEVTFPEPTTAVGVQFWGDDNDGWANVFLVGTDLRKTLMWDGNTMGSPSAPFEEYIEIRDLSRDRHVLRIEPTGRAGRDGGDIHVTMAMFGWGPIENPDDGPSKVFLPIFFNDSQ